MASTYNYPEDYIAWFIKGNHLAIVTLKGETSGSTHSKYGQYKPIDEAVTNGVLIHYSAEPNAVSALTDVPDIDNTMHSSLIDFVKYRLYQDKAGSIADGNVAAVSMNMARTHESKWIEATKRFGMKKRDKTGGPRRIMPADLR